MGSEKIGSPERAPLKNMVPPSYQAILWAHLMESQYITLEILLLLQAHRQVTIEIGA